MYINIKTYEIVKENLKANEISNKYYRYTQFYFQTCVEKQFKVSSNEKKLL